MDEQGRPLYGDVFGVYKEENGETVIPGTETPAAVQLRKEAGDETPYEPKSLFTHLEEVEVTGDKGLMPVTKKYVIPGKAN